MYSLLSVYSILKPPQFGNTSECEDDHFNQDVLAANFDFFQESNESNYENSFRQNYLTMVEKCIENSVTVDPWINEDLTELGPELSTSVIDNLIYTNTGYVCRIMLLKPHIKQCVQCLKAFASEKENAIFPVSQLLEIRSKGFLIYPKLKLFYMIHQLHPIVMNHLQKALKYMFEDILQELGNSQIKLTFSCDQHKVQSLVEALLHYIWTKMWHFEKDYKKRQKLQSALLKKEAKLKKF